jgi:3-oxoacyl-[acyl-carrier protein] reductase
MSLINKVAIITGSSRGIGAELAKKLAFDGAKVVINYSGNQALADELVENIKSTKGEAFAVKADVSQSNQVASLFDQTIKHFGGVDILINNAGIAIYKKIEDTSDDDFDKVFNINVKGTFLTMREAAKRLNDGGRIVNLSSSVTRMMLPTYATYSATKSAVEQMTKVFAKEIGYRGITVNSVSPGPTNTELFTNGKTQETINKLASMSAFNRIGEPNDIANLVLFLVGEEANWITAQNIAVNGGFA